MTAKKKHGSGRVTPKGTKNPAKESKAGRPGLPEAPDHAGAPQAELAGKVSGKQGGKVARPVSHNRGNR